MYSHEELISAVCAAGRDGKTFTVKDVRAQLGFHSGDKKELSRFRRRLRAFEKTAADQLEKLANNSYRLRPGAFEEQAAVAAPVQVEPVKMAEKEVQLEPASGVFQSVAPANEPVEQEAPARDVAAPAVAAEPAVEEAPARDVAAVAAEAPVKAPARDVAEPSVAPDVAVEAPARDVAAAAAPAAVASDAAVKEAPARDVAAVAAPAAVEAPAVHEPEPAVAPAPAAVEAPAYAAYAATPDAPSAPRASSPQRVIGVASALVTGAFAASAAVSGRVREHSRNLREQLWACLRSAPARKHAFARLRGWAEGLRPLSSEVREQLTALRQRVLSSRRRAA